MKKWIKVSNVDNHWNWVARDKDGTLYLYSTKPYAKNFNEGTWSGKDTEEVEHEFKDYGYTFSGVNWNDGEPTELVHIISTPRIIPRGFIHKRWKWIARDKFGSLCAYEEKPVKLNSWWACFDAANGYKSSIYITEVEKFIDTNIFSEIKWEDYEPTMIED